MTHLAQELILWELSGEPLLDQSLVRSVRLGDPDQQLVANSGPRPPKPERGRWGERGGVWVCQGLSDLRWVYSFAPRAKQQKRRRR